MLKLITASIIAAFVLFIATYRPPKKPDPTPKEEIIYKNPLDQILGEHWFDNGTLRSSNFDSILHIPAKNLTDSSEYYQITELRKNLFLLKRKKFYLDNRRYSLILETKNNRIIAVHPFLDLAIIDAVVAEDKLFIIQGDYSEIASHWRPTYQIKISGLDSHCRELWNVTSAPNKGLFFLGYKLYLKDDQLLAGFGIQRAGSSTMCVSDYVVFLSKDGEINKFEENGGYSCGPRPNMEVGDLMEIF